MTEITRASEVLKAALKLINKPEKWVTGVDHAKRPVKLPGKGPGKYIDCYCARGAVREVTNNIKSGRLFDRAIRCLHDAIPYPDMDNLSRCTVTGYNDTRRKHSEIVAWFKQAIRNAKKAGS